MVNLSSALSNCAASPRVQQWPRVAASNLPGNHRTDSTAGVLPGAGNLFALSGV
jgi:hypothetical protein